MGFQDSWLNISMSSLVRRFLRHRAEKMTDRHTDRQTNSAEKPYHATSVGVGSKSSAGAGIDDRSETKSIILQVQYVRNKNKTKSH